MIATENQNTQIRSLLHTTDPVCVSIIIPLHPPSTDRTGDTTVLRTAIGKALQYLADRFGQHTVAPLQSSLDEMAVHTIMPHHALGIGLFVSTHIKLHTSFFFPVEEKIVVSDSFEIRDLLFQMQYASPYWVLHLANKGTSLFEGLLGNLREVQDGHFPTRHKDTLEYSRPSPGPGYAGDATARKTEHDQSYVKKLRYERFLKKTDTLLDTYITPQSGLIIAGVELNLSAFKRQTRHGVSIVGRINGNYTDDPQRLSALAWDIAKLHTDQRVKELIGRLNEKIGASLIITGLHEIWKAAKEGRAYRLLVEKDYRIPGFLVIGDDRHLYLAPPTKAHIILPDAIDGLMETVLSKSGDVVPVENGWLASYQRVVLIARY
ncbi:hypothetical protein JHJ32_08005 [Parapedobacter sp. ISTM3]|uniref:baeRF3 domain-containing protein n=1 Tax=Parapedobacter sp. ISTM3 TaxID=2800130 RepID=UPI001908A8E9|nr:hypothetical protein [Parapedobacter sp. ISTM3]MBK1439923.1 hypothetical protein [Parapedobacter sp. ISTM3]